MAVYHTFSPPRNVMANDKFRNPSETTLCGLLESKETDSLLCSTLHEEIVPQLMRYRDLPKVYDTTEKALAEDPLDRFLTDTPDKHKGTRRWKAGRKASLYLQFCKAIHAKAGWTINHGESIMSLEDPARKEGPLDKALNLLFAQLAGGIRKLTVSKEQQERTTEFYTKWATARESLGDRISQMIEVGTLGTTPERQHRGYASTLVHVATDLADARAVPSWLYSSNIMNRDFYRSFGFEIVVTFYLGEDDPTWTAPPVPIDIMVREPKGVKGRANEKTMAMTLEGLV